MALALAADPTSDGPLPDDAPWKPIPDQTSYRFCTDPGVDAEAARAWCDLLDELPPDACPGLRESCAGLTGGNTEDRDFLSGCRGGGAGPDKTPTFTAPPPPPAAPPTSCDAPSMGDGWAALLRWTVALGIALGVLLLARLIFLRFLGSKRDDPTPTLRENIRSNVDPVAVPNRPSGDLLTEAEAALADGRLGDAVLLARAAALKKLGERGRIHLAASRTDREYVRAIEPESRESLRTIMRAVEEHRWARRPLEESQARRALDAAVGLVRVPLVATMLLLLPFAANAGSRYGPEGDAALFEAYHRAGYDVSWRLRGLSSLEDDLDVLVLDLSTTAITQADADNVRAWVERGGALIVTGDASTITPLGDFEAVVAEQGLSLGDAASYTDLPVPVLPGGARFAWNNPTGTPWVALADGRALVEQIELGTGMILSIADSRLLHNGALLARANEGFLVAAPYAGTDIAAFGTPSFELPIPARLQLATRAGNEAENPFESLWNARLLPLVLQILLIGALVGLWRGWPFAPPKDHAADERTAFTDHLRALGRRWHRLGATRRAVGQYARYGLERLGPEGLRQAALRHGASEEEARTILDRAMKAAADLEGPDDPKDDLSLMETLWTLLRRT